MVENVVLHIGMHKTGSSSIQESLFHYDDSHTIYASFDVPDHSQPIFTAFSNDYLKYHVWVNSGLTIEEIENRRINYRSAFSTMLQREDRKRIIVSAEDISILTDEEKLGLVSFIRDHGCDVSIVCYVREPLGYAASSFQQDIKGGFTGFPERIFPSYVARLEPFLQIVSRERITVRVFDRRRLLNGDVVADFCDLLGLDVSRISPVMANVGLSLPAAKLLFMFNRLSIIDSGDAALYRARLRLISEVQEKYSNAEKLPTAIFRGVADFSELAFLNDNFGCGIEDISTQAFEAGNVDEIKSIFLNVADIDVSGINELLAENNINPNNFSLIQDKMMRLYMAFVSDETNKVATSSRFLRDPDADILRDIAFKIDGGAPLDREDALRLLRLAERARPHGHLIKMKIEEITSSH